ncbi:hypothetical protein HALLA_12015 [Halostagnicola larsenii XH-48]|uniref:Terminase large subunit gp17-like C-terminal domain-containing protein n=1 Tax=Halostagnicola larsenii XH-48 TaxID=797299 RepID=W0JV37_9EURY|nr:hypothetical protein [Halostagnicola larsenii]AHG00903.1 hypothetical protein HALLA_11725 [Halostagnicola larsenii XH-48]AHG00950.1 hypothetical protein HALLA_12015 [Halostagnicola larsenii XH-48]
MSTQLAADLDDEILEAIENYPLEHPTTTSIKCFDYSLPPGEHLKRVYNALYKAVRPEFPYAPTRLAALLPRGSGKSDGVGVVFPTWLILNLPSLRVAIVSKTADLAAERTEKAVERIEHWAPAAGVEIADSARTQLTTASNNHKEPSIAPYGLESQLTGKHFDVIVYDDIADWDNQRTDTQRRNVRNHFQDYEKNLPDNDSGLEQGPVQAVIGTRKHPADVYATEILDSARWDVMIHKAIHDADWDVVENRDWKVRGEDGKVYDDVADLPAGISIAPNGVIPDEEIRVIWPEQRPPEAVLYDLVDGDESVAIWRRENQQDPGALSGEVFKSDWLIYNDELPRTPDRYRWFGGMDIGVVDDLQKAAENDTDYSALAIVGAHPSGDEAYLPLLDRARGMSVKANADWAHDLLEGFAKAYGIEFDQILVEANKSPGVAQRLRDNSTFPVQPIESSGSKEGRIHDLAAKFESGELQIVGDPSGECSPDPTSDLKWEDFETEEWLQFPNAAHDDMLDGVEMAMQAAGDGAWNVGVGW